MAIKIKKKDGSQEPESSSEVEEAEQLSAAEAAKAALSEDADPFLRASWETASWIEENRGLVLGAIAIVLIAVIGGYFGLQVLESQKVEASSTLTPAFDDFTTILEGSPQHEAIKANPDLEMPEKTFPNDKARWQAVYDDAEKTLSTHPKGDVAQAARLTKAAAAIKLEKPDEAIALYQAYLGNAQDEAMKVAVLQGLATAYARAEKWDEALKTLDELAAVDEDFVSGVKYQKARLLQRAGKKEEAKALFHEILDKEPDHPSKSDIERRLATM